MRINQRSSTEIQLNIVLQKVAGGESAGLSAPKANCSEGTSLKHSKGDKRRRGVFIKWIGGWLVSIRVAMAGRKSDACLILRPERASERERGFIIAAGCIRSQLQRPSRALFIIYIRPRARSLCVWEYLSPAPNISLCARGGGGARIYARRRNWQNKKEGKQKLIERPGMAAFQCIPPAHADCRGRCWCGILYYVCSSARTRERGGGGILMRKRDLDSSMRGGAKKRSGFVHSTRKFTCNAGQTHTHSTIHIPCGHERILPQII